MLRWGLESEIHTFLGQAQLGVMCSLYGSEYVVCTATQTFFMSPNHTISMSSPHVYAAITYAVSLDMVFAVNTGVCRLCAFQPRNPLDFYLKDYELNMQSVSQLYYDATSNAIIAIGSEIKIWKISRNKKVASPETRLLLEPFGAVLPTTSFVQDLHDVYVDEPRKRIFIPARNGYIVSHYDGQIAVNEQNISSASFTAVSLILAPKRLKNMIENKEKIAPINMYKRFFAVDIEGNLRLWHKSGKLLHHFDTKIFSIIFAEFISSEFVILVEKTGKIYIVDVKTCRSVLIENIERKPDRVALLRNPDRLAISSVNEFFVFKINTLWTIWYKPISTAFSIGRYLSSNDSGMMSRVGIFSDDGFFRLISPKNRQLIAAATVKNCLTPITVSYNRQCQEDFVIMSFDNDSLQFFQINDDTGDFESVKTVKSNTRYALIAKCFENQEWAIISIGPSGDISVLEWNTLERKKRLWIDQARPKFLFWDQFNKNLIMISERKLLILSLETFIVNFNVVFKCPKCAAFENGLLIVAYNDGNCVFYDVSDKEVAQFSELHFNNKIDTMNLQYGLHIFLFEDQSLIIGNRYNFTIASIWFPYQVKAASFLNLNLDLLLCVEKEVMLLQAKKLYANLEPLVSSINENDNISSDSSCCPKIEPRITEKKVDESKYTYENVLKEYDINRNQSDENNNKNNKDAKNRTRHFKTVSKVAVDNFDDDDFINDYINFKSARIELPPPPPIKTLAATQPIGDDDENKAKVRDPVNLISGKIRSGQKPDRFSYSRKGKNGKENGEYDDEEEDEEEEGEENAEKNNGNVGFESKEKSEKNLLEIKELTFDQETQTNETAIERIKAKELAERRRKLMEEMMRQKRNSQRKKDEGNESNDENNDENNEENRKNDLLDGNGKPILGNDGKSSKMSKGKSGKKSAKDSESSFLSKATNSKKSFGSISSKRSAAAAKKSKGNNNKGKGDSSNLAKAKNQNMPGDLYFDPSADAIGQRKNVRNKGDPNNSNGINFGAYGVNGSSGNPNGKGAKKGNGNNQNGGNDGNYPNDSNNKNRNLYENYGNIGNKGKYGGGTDGWDKNSPHPPTPLSGEINGQNGSQLSPRHNRQNRIISPGGRNDPNFPNSSGGIPNFMDVSPNFGMDSQPTTIFRRIVGCGKGDNMCHFCHQNHLDESCSPESIYDRLNSPTQSSFTRECCSSVRSGESIPPEPVKIDLLPAIHQRTPKRKKSLIIMPPERRSFSARKLPQQIQQQQIQQMQQVFSPLTTPRRAESNRLALRNEENGWQTLSGRANTPSSSRSILSTPEKQALWESPPSSPSEYSRMNLDANRIRFNFSPPSLSSKYRNRDHHYQYESQKQQSDNNEPNEQSEQQNNQHVRNWNNDECGMGDQFSRSGSARNESPENMRPTTNAAATMRMTKRRRATDGEDVLTREMKETGALLLSEQHVWAAKMLPPLQKII